MRATRAATTEAIDTARRAFAAGDLAAAERSCAAALAADPGAGQAWALLTETALLRERPDAAMVCAERAVTLLPREPLAQVLKAKCLMLTGDPAGARQAAEAAARLEGAAPETLDALGALFGMLGEHQRAAELFRRAVAARPGIAQYLFNLAATERMSGDLEAAEAHCDAAIARHAHYALAHYLRADLRTQTRERNHVAQLEELIQEGRLGPEGEVTVRFALVKELEDLAEHARAFEQVAAACALHRRSIEYQPQAELEQIEAIIRTQSAEWLARLERGTSGSAPVFVVGLPRTGTTLVERIIVSHSAMTSAGETGAFAAQLQRAARNGAAGAVGVAEFGRRYLEAVAAYGVPPGRRFVDKSLHNYLHCALIHAALPGARIILVRRHPLDACWAMYKAYFRGHFAFSYDLRELAGYLLAFRRLAQHWRATLPRDVLLEVAYEDVVRDQAGQSRRIIEFLALPWEDGVLRFHESPAPSTTASAVQVRRPVYSSSVGAWRRHAERLEPARVRLAQEIPATELE